MSTMKACPVCRRVAEVMWNGYGMCRACARSYDRHPDMTDAEAIRWQKRRRQLVEARREAERRHARRRKYRWVYNSPGKRDRRKGDGYGWRRVRVGSALSKIALRNRSRRDKRGCVRR